MKESSPYFRILNNKYEEDMMSETNYIYENTTNCVQSTLNSRLSGIMVGMEITINRKPG
jgi:hypothetical protein